MKIALINGENTMVKDALVLERIIGQNEAKNKLAFFIRSSSTKNCMPTLLFTGSQGLGKTYMAYKVAEALGRELIDINCRIVTTAEEFIEKVVLDRISGNTPKTLLLDESQMLSNEISTILLTLLNPNEENVNYIPYKKAQLEWDLNKINVILATTDAYRLPRALVNRCTEIYFKLYTNEELFKILKSYLGNVVIANSLEEELAYACRGRARDAYILATYINRYCDMMNSNIFGARGWREVKSVMGLHAYGLKTQEVEFLRILKGATPISLNNLAIKMGLNTFNIEDEVEPRVRELGFIESGTRGRVLTDIGRKYLEKVV